ncbi:4Fe-4S dicluster domain-containing protein [Wukongibacter baidiensis]|uniref:4Fe-4S dicluster domain-containing protein n=1 Tax=Wukongibacter baidiensis TaxID=1723361 RepID=UPI003D7F4140
MVRRMAIIPNKCTGCTTCVLTCSISHNDRFNLSSSYIKVKKNDICGIFEISFSSTCLSCYKCAEVCPAGCLEIVNIVDLEVKEGS